MLLGLIDVIANCGLKVRIALKVEQFTRTTMVDIHEM